MQFKVNENAQILKEIKLIMTAISSMIVIRGKGPNTTTTALKHRTFTHKHGIFFKQMIIKVCWNNLNFDILFTYLMFQISSPICILKKTKKSD